MHYYQNILVRYGLNYIFHFPEQISCYAFNLYSTSEQDAHTTAFSNLRII
jgi:hypothetical protein